jgi:hypothetical protein
LRRRGGETERVGDKERGRREDVEGEGGEDVERNDLDSLTP